MPKLSYDGTFNVRDLGGIPTQDGKTTKAGVFIRSGNLDKVLDTSQQALIDYGVSTVFDLRSEWEQENYRNVFADNPQVVYQNLPLIKATLMEQSDDDEQDKTATIYDRYITYIDSCQAQIKDIITTLVSIQGTAMFHCHAGKDRTSITSALLLGAVGVSDNAIADDYGRSRDEVDHLIAEMTTYLESQGRDTSLVERMMTAEPETMLKTLAYIRDTYGSVDTYLTTCGVSDETLAGLRVKFIE